MTKDKNNDLHKILQEDMEVVYRCGVCGDEFKTEKKYRVHHAENH